jgi:iron complex transport system ATP-binding protein
VTSLRLSDVSVLAGARPLLEHASLQVRRGELVALLGPNGAGKTTLLRAALGLTSVSSGEVRIGETSLQELSERERAAELAWLPQQSAPSEPLPAREAVMAARYRFRETAAKSRHEAERALERVGLSRFADAPLTTLSGGERQRVAIAALLAQEARFLLLDEPANHLDPAQQAETYALLGSLVDDGIGLLCVTHDVNLLGNVRRSPRVVGLAAGRLRFELDYEAEELPERLSELFGVRMLPLAAGSGRVIVPAPRAHEGRAS